VDKLGGEASGKAAVTNTHIMLDLETWGTRPGSALRTIAACEFDPWGYGVGEMFHVAIDSGDQCGLTFDEASVQWWNDPERAEANDAILAMRHYPLHVALYLFRDWIESFGPNVLIWSNGADSDSVLVEAAYRAAGLKSPFGDNADHCFRTLKAIAGSPHRVA
jgi:hypothetical protein